MGEIKLYNAPNKTVENVGIFRTSLDNEPVAYSAIFGFYPTHHCSFTIITEDRNDRMKKIAELHDELVKNGFINRTPKGRVATDFAYEHFNRTRE